MAFTPSLWTTSRTLYHLEALARNYESVRDRFVDFGLATLFMKQVIPRVWSASARIPDNPEARSKPAFRFMRHLDALSFAWEVAIEVHRVMAWFCSRVTEKLGLPNKGLQPTPDSGSDAGADAIRRA